MQETKNTPKSLAAAFLCIVLALIVALAAALAFSPKTEEGTNGRLKEAIDTAVEGNAGYEDVTADYITDGEARLAVYLVKSGTGGKDGYCVFTTAKSRGCTVEALTAFSFDGVIMSVQLLDVSGGVYNAKELVLESGVLSSFGGVSYDSETVNIKGAEGAGGCNGAVVLAVNKACNAMKSVLYTEEEVSQ